MKQEETVARLSTGINGLDEILSGGLLPHRAYLVHGGPGTGKTTIGLYFLSAGTQAGEETLFISLEESENQIRNNARSLGIDIDKVHFLDLSPSSDYFAKVETYDIFSPAEVEREPLTNRIITTIKKIQPVRVFLDPLTQLRYLSSDVYQFRKQTISFLRFLIEEGATVLFTSEASQLMPDDDLQFIADGIIDLNNEVNNRTITITKFRGSMFKKGNHTLKFHPYGLRVYPQVVAEEHRKEFKYESLSSGIPELDMLLHGGLERGTVTFLSGPTGVGKTTLGLQCMKEAATRKERSVLYLFEEEIDIVIKRAEGLQMPIRQMMESGYLDLQRINPLEYSGDQFYELVRREVENNNATLIMLDSIQGYRLNMSGEEVESHLYALTRYLKNMGIATLLSVETSQVTGDFRVTDMEVSYMADNILFLRYIEFNGELRRAIGVLKKRLTDFEKTLREFTITPKGIIIGKPLTNLRGILTGEPNWHGAEDESE